MSGSWTCNKCGEAYDDAYPRESHMRVCGTLMEMGRKDKHDTIVVLIRTRDDHRFELESPYDSRMPRMARALGGRWANRDKVWVFDNAREHEVTYLCREIYGVDPKVDIVRKTVMRKCPHEVINYHTGVCAGCGQICDSVEPPRKVRSIFGLKPGDLVNVTTRNGKVDDIRKLVVEKTMTKDEAVAFKHEWLGNFAELELRTLAHAIDGLFTSDGLLSDDVSRRQPDGSWKFPRHIIVMGVNEKLAALDKRVKMLEAERGPGIKYDPLVVHCDNGED